MSIERLFNHTVRVYREPDPEDARDSFGYVPAEPLPIGAAPTALNAMADMNWGGNLDDRGPGEQQITMRRWFLDKSLDVAERDVLQVTAGPESPMNIRVLAVAKPANPRAHHHTEVIAEVWKGELGPVSS